MVIELTPEQIAVQAEFKEFADNEIIPYANQFDREECLPVELIKKIALKGYLGATIPVKYGGMGMDMITLGLLNEEFGRGYASVQNMLTVCGMVIQGILKCGSRVQKEKWLPKIAAGEIIVAYGLTEPDVGSDIKGIETTAEISGDCYILNGKKKWTTLGQLADLFLIFAKCDEKPCAFLVERNTPGLFIKPISGVLGLRANMLAELNFENCPVPAENLVGKMGTGLSHVASFSLDQGRYTTAWGCVGLAQACLNDCVSYARKRKQFGVHLRQHQLIQKMVTEMVADIKAARQLCYYCGYLRDTSDPESVTETLVAKYFASKMVNMAAGHAVQIHGANGCGNEFSVQRYLRDAKIMEIIEGATQMYEILIAMNAFRGHS